MSTAWVQVEKPDRPVSLCQGLLTKIKILQHLILALQQTSIAGNAVPTSKFAERKLFQMINIWSNCVWKQIRKLIFF